MKIKLIEKSFCIARDNEYISDALPKFNSYQEAEEWLDLVTNKLKKSAIEIIKTLDEIERGTGSTKAKLTLKPHGSYK